MRIVDRRARYPAKDSMNERKDSSPVDLFLKLIVIYGSLESTTTFYQQRYMLTQNDVTLRYEAPVAVREKPIA